jgi:hypothetical protein
LISTDFGFRYGNVLQHEEKVTQKASQKASQKMSQNRNLLKSSQNFDLNLEKKIGTKPKLVEVKSSQKSSLI